MTKSASCNRGNTVITIKEHSKRIGNIVCSYGGDYIDCCFLGRDAVMYVLYESSLPTDVS
jgi:hypothetical protein